MEYTTRNLRFSVIEPGRVETDLFAQKAGQEEGFIEAFGDVEPLHAEDIAAAIAFIVTNPAVSRSTRS